MFRLEISQTCIKSKRLHNKAKVFSILSYLWYIRNVYMSHEIYNHEQTLR